jgi:hypothetical protein
MTDKITNDINFDIRGSGLLLEFSLGVLQTNIESALLINHFSRLTNSHLPLYYHCITIFLHIYFNDSMALYIK